MKGSNGPDFPSGTPMTINATWLDKVWLRVRFALGAALNALGVPAVIKPVEVNDSITGLHVFVTIEPLFTIVSIDGNDFYFRRLSGEYDGSGKEV